VGVARHPEADEPPPGAAGPAAVAPGAVDVRSASLAVLAALAIVFSLRVAQEVFVPLVLGIVVSHALEPLVTALTRVRIPRPLGAFLVLGACVAGLGGGVWALQDDARAMVDELPAAARKLRQALRQVQGGETAIGKVHDLASEIERGAAEAAGVEPADRGVPRVQVEERPLNFPNLLWTGSLGVIGVVGQAILLLFLVYFLLASGDLYKRKLVALVGPSLGRKRVTVQVLDDISLQVQRFLSVQLVTAAVVALASWLAFRWLGLAQAAVWGIAAGVLNTVPYFGPLLVMAGVAMVGVVQFGSVAMAASLAGVAFAITSIEGYLLTPVLLGRAVRMNQVAVFVGLLFWTWMWGIVGILLAVPVMAMVKAVCDRVEDLRPIGELLGE
jgi:predicted PurR-regulated permease PerM